MPEEFGPEADAERLAERWASEQVGVDPATLAEVIEEHQ